MGTFDNTNFNYVFHLPESISNRINFIYLLFTFLIIITLFSSKHRKTSFFLFSNIIFFIAFMSINYDRIRYYTLYAYFFFIIPLSIIGLMKLYNSKQLIWKISSIIIILVLLSLFVIENVIPDANQYVFTKDFSEMQTSNKEPPCVIYPDCMPSEEYLKKREYYFKLLNNL